MYPTIQLGLLTLPTYATIICISFIIIFCMMLKHCQTYGILPTICIRLTIHGMIGILIGGTLLFAFTQCSQFTPDYIVTIALNTLLNPNNSSGGMVFYGGLIGGITGLVIGARQYHLPALYITNFYCPYIALWHGFGRLGCLLGGCCYGVEYDGICSVTYPYDTLLPQLRGSTRFPTQLIEAVLLFALSIGLFYLLYKKSYQITGCYLTCYSIIRFLLEYTRGDVERGIFLHLSTSQWISIPLFFVGIMMCNRHFIINDLLKKE